VNIPLSLGQYSAIGVGLIVLDRTIQYLVMTRYLRQRGIATKGGRSPISDWNEWAAYRKARLSAHQPLTWWGLHVKIWY
jgi:hypothetical protein